MMYYLPIVMVILSSVAYHYCQKTIDTQTNPYAVLAISYGAAAISTFTLLFITGGSLSVFKDTKLLSVAPIVLGMALFGIELGYLLSYRASWPISTTAVISHITADSLLVLIGLTIFGEALTPQKSAGLLFALTGIFLILR